MGWCEQTVDTNGDGKITKPWNIQTGQRDKSTACSYALVFLKKAEADDEKRVAEYKARPIAQARRPMNDEMWGKLQHPDEDRFISALFQVVSPMVASPSSTMT